MILRVSGGEITRVYDEALDLSALGPALTERASHVEPAGDGTWFADLAPIGGPKLSGFARRSEALQAEVAWIEKWLERSGAEPEER